MIKDRIKFCNNVYQYQGYFFQIYCICIFQAHIPSCCGAKFLVSGVFVFFGSFCFFCLSFCHPVGGRDSLKKRKIHQEPVFFIPR